MCWQAVQGYKYVGQITLCVQKRVVFFDTLTHPGVNTKVSLCFCSEGLNEERPHIEQSLFTLLPTRPNGPFIQLGWLMDKSSVQPTQQSAAFNEAKPRRVRELCGQRDEIHCHTCTAE